MKKILAVVLATLLVSLMPLAMADDVTVTGDVDKAIAVTFNYASVGFGTLTQGSTNSHPAPDYTGGVYNASVDTNFAWQVSVNGTDFDDGGGHTFNVGNLTVDTSATTSLTPATAVTTSPAVVDTYSTTGENIDNFHGYLLDVPSYQYATSYSSTLTWTYENQ
jgi:hypothetical protein